MRAQVCNARWGNSAAEAEARPAPAAGVSTFFRLRSSHLVAPAVLPPVPWTRLTISTLRNTLPGRFSTDFAQRMPSLGYTLYSMKGNAWLTLAMGGVFVGAKQLAEAAGVSGALGPVTAALAVVGEVGGAYLIHRAHSQGEKQRETAELRELAERNHHLRQGMAAALRRGLAQARLKIPGLPSDPYDALFQSWDLLLGQAEAGGDALEQSVIRI